MKVGIIGGGLSGVLSLKCCKEEGLEAVCFESANQIGGVWSHHEPKEGQSHMYDGLLTNTSKELTTFSDHPFPDDAPSFLTCAQIHEYLLSYCERFNLMEDIRLEHRVLNLQKTEDHDDTGCWEITVEDLRSDGGKVTYRFDAVMLCTGLHTYPFTPELPNMEKFKGTISHSHIFTNHTEYDASERIMVVGNSSSGLDLTTQLAKRQPKVIKLIESEGVTSQLQDNMEGDFTAQQALREQNKFISSTVSTTVKSNNPPVYLSSRSPIIVLKRNYGNPWDTKLTLLSATIATWFPSLYDRILYYALFPMNKHFKKFDKWLEMEVGTPGALSDKIFECLEAGKVQAVGGISEFTETGVIFNDGEELELDRVIFATGYQLKFPFMNEDVLDLGKWCLYKRIWPVHQKKNTLAAIGFARSGGSTFPAFELQARWAVQVFKGKKLPSPEKMRSRTPTFSNKNCSTKNLMVFNLPYSISIAGEVGCYPSLGLFLRHPMRWFAAYFGTAYPYVFRLCGPGNKSEDAWKLIQTAKSRIHPQQQQLEKVEQKREKRQIGIRSLGVFLIICIGLVMAFVH